MELRDLCSIRLCHILDIGNNVEEHTNYKSSHEVSTGYC
jgi:hypothetical protein